MKYILGIDIGTGSTKAVALDLSYRPVDSCQRHYPTFTPVSNASEQNPEEIWQALVWCINEMFDRYDAAPVAIGLSSAMHSLILVNAEGEAIAPMMTWADSRSAELAEKLKSTAEGKGIYEITGTPVHAMSPLCKLLWLEQNESAVFQSAYKFISIKEYLWYRLFNVYEIDHSIASCTGLFDIRDLVWSAEALALAQIGLGHLSEPVSTGHVRQGLAASAGMLSRLQDVPFVIGASDGCLANLGSNAVVPGIAAITIGTSGAVRVACVKPVSNQAMTFSYILDEQTYICGGPVNNGGIALQWLLKNIFDKAELLPDDYSWVFEQVGSVAPGSEGLFFLPYLTGERAPIWDASSSGTFFGMRLQHSQAHLSRAVLEGICYALNDVLHTVEQYTGGVQQIHVSGGFVHSAVWMQMLADITGKKIVLVQTEDASAIGAAFLGARAIGLEKRYPSAPEGDKIIIVPDLDCHQSYKKDFLTYKQLYLSLKEIMQAAAAH